jgi:predicted dehydrogenase
MTDTILHLGIVGACGRGASFKNAIDAIDSIHIQAVCDTNAADLPAAAERLGAELFYTDYETMLKEANLDAVLIGTPMPFHVPQSIAALQHNISVLSEVPAGVNIAECRELVRAVKQSQATYMIAENYINYIYAPPIILVRELARHGLFGTPYYAEGEYVHELKELNEITKWRRKWQTGINGNTYPTHSLGPILQWMPGDRVISVACVGSGHHYTDPRGDHYENEDTTITLCKLQSGGLAKLRLDMLSDRPHRMNTFQLQGTDGAFESARAKGETDRVWLRSHSKDRETWLPLQTFEEEFLPQNYKQGLENARRTGHGGGDYFVIADFVDALLGKAPLTLDIHAAMDMTLPGLVSQQSILEGGRWLDVPDSRDWNEEIRQD